MNQLTQAGSSNVTTFVPMKRRRGRPRKDPSIKHVEDSRAPPGYEGRENIHRQANTIDFSNGGMVGQTVTGVIEAAFDAGYMLTVRIDNSNTNFRGVVFKPGHAAPLTALNDIAPHVQMCKRIDLPLPLQNQPHNNGPRERTEINDALHLSQGQILSSQLTPLVASKGKQALTVSSSTHLNGRGTVVPVVLQPATAFSASPHSDLSDKDVVAAEPLSVLLPFGSSSSNQFLSTKSKLQPSRAPPGSSQNANYSYNNGPRVKQRGEDENMTQADATVMQGSSEPSNMHNGKSDACAAVSQLGMNQGTPDISSSPATLHQKNEGSGSMTDLLQAMQEKFRPVVDSNVELQNGENPNFESNDQATW